MKILSLVGARPQFVKEAILCEEFKKRNIEEIIVNSGQHYDENMSDIFFKVLNIKNAGYNLNVGSGKHGEMTGKIMMEFEKVAETVKPDAIIVYGDTNTTLAGAIVAAKMKIPIAHVEAGIRQKPEDMPEEINRVLTDHASTFLFCASKSAVLNLKKENITENVVFSGDVMYDLFMKMEKLFLFDVYEKLGLKESEYMLLTLHRDFNVDIPEVFRNILEKIELISREIKIVFPVHPRTLKRIKDNGFEKYISGVILTEPVDYLNLMGLTKNSMKVITDSGGLQKEAYFAGKESIVVMPDTGWRELVECGWNKLADGSNLFDAVINSSTGRYIKGIYGDGDAGKKIVDYLTDYFG
jgi:UDP-N-acetylglucosamine 2-epimerase